MTVWLAVKVIQISKAKFFEPCKNPVEMAIISMFYGIIISMYFFDNRQHKLPHVHTRYQEHEAVFSIPDATLIDGDIPQNKARLVQAWIEIHKEDLMADWELASSGQEIFKIDPLK